MLATIEAGGAAAAPAPRLRPPRHRRPPPRRRRRRAGQQAPARPATRPPRFARRCAARCSNTASIPATVKGTGKDGRITKDDVIAAAATPAPRRARRRARAAPRRRSAAASTARKEERVRMTRLRQTVAKRLKEAQNTAAMLTTFNDVDMTAVIEARAKYKDLFEKKHGVRLGFMGFFVKAACMALKDVPGGQRVRSTATRSSITIMPTSRSRSRRRSGLVVPVIRDADQLSVAGIEKTIGDFGKRAKDGTLKMDEMKGGTFTISNGGVFGSLMSTPIINPPQSAVLGLHRIEDRPVVRDGQVVVRPMMYLALSYDHRLIDGREAVTFLVALKNAIEDPTRLLIDL